MSLMQTHVYLRPAKKILEPHPAVESLPSIGVIRKVSGTTIHAAAPYIRRLDATNPDPGRILDNVDAGFVDKERPLFIDL
jgi:hypothetical protein